MVALVLHAAVHIINVSSLICTEREWQSQAYVLYRIK